MLQTRTGTYTFDHPPTTPGPSRSSTTMALGSGRQLLLLLWKNWLLQKRKKILTALQIILPTAGAVIFLAIRTIVTSTPYDDGQTWGDFTVDDLPYSIRGAADSVGLAYAPDSAVTRSVMDRVGNYLNITPSAFANESALTAAFEHTSVDTTIWGGIVFTNPSPPAMEYTIRPRSQRFEDIQGAEGDSTDSIHDWLTEYTIPEFLTPGPRESYDNTSGQPNYESLGFLAVMRAVDRALIAELNGTSGDDIEVRLQRLAYPSYVDDPYVSIIESQLPFLILIGYIFIVPDIASMITLEKEKRLKEYMKIMGLSNWLHWTAWFLKAFIMLLISVIVMTILFVVETTEGATLNATDSSVLFVFLILYTISSISFAFMISVFFKKASSSGAAAGLLFYLSYIPYLVMDVRTMQLPTIMMAALLNNVALSLGCRQIALYEGTGAGVTWENFAQPVSDDDDLTMAHVCGMLALDICIYLLITWYFDNVLPGEYGIPRKWYFPFTKSYWCGDSAEMRHTEAGEDAFEADPEFFEKNPANVKPGISIRNLRKEFKRGKTVKVAVAGTSLDMFEGQVTALLGHNGAGKTTTMSMLTGFMPPSGGTAKVNGFDIRTQMSHVRSSLGLCPQHDVLFDTLTVQEHLEFYAMLKGCPRSSLKEEVDNMIATLGLDDKRTKASKTLSGGMKRKLSMGIALIYGSKIVVLDEPTSGMDPEARRKAWDILQSQRAGRTVLLSTHFMDEADLLGDRIAIMAEGVVKCCGSSMFLKNKYGVGYHLVMVKDTECNVDTITEYVLKHVPDAMLESNVSAELSYTLPRESSGNFEALFGGLEENRSTLGIASFGASVTTMEEVFMKVGESSHTEEEPVTSRKSSVANSKETDVAFTNMAFSSENGDLANPNPKTNGHPSDHYEAPGKKTGLGLLMQQFKGMFIKRVIHTLRNRLVLGAQIIMPCIFTLLAVVSSQSTAGDPEVPPARLLSLSTSTQQIVLFTTDISESLNTVLDLANAFENAVESDVDQVRNVTDEGLDDYIMGIGLDSMDSYTRKHLIAGEFVGTSPAGSATATGVFNAQAYHTVAIALSAIDNAILKYATTNNGYTIEVTNHPLPMPDELQAQQDVSEALGLGFSVAINILFGMTFMVATFVVFLIKERESNAKHVQFVSGVHTVTFWLSTYFWDLLNYMIPAILIVIILVAMGVDAYIGTSTGCLLLLLLLFGMAVLPFTYLVSFLFKKPSSGYTWTTVLHNLLGISSIVAVFILSIPGLGTEDVADTLRWVFYVIIPNFCLGVGLMDLYSNYYNADLCIGPDAPDYDARCMLAATFSISDPCCPDVCGLNDGICAYFTSDLLAWEYPGIGRSLLFLLLQSIFYFLFIFFLESGTCKSLGQRILAGATAGNSDTNDGDINMSSRPLLQEDQDVKDERERIQTNPTFELEQQNVLVLKELRKYYGGFLAVDRLSVGIPAGECFGLLGVNGAGKTTTFKMMTGDIPVSSGDALLEGYSIKRDIKQVQRRLGYCPQFDALIDQMTVEETLFMYARLRGIQEDKIPAEVERTITSVLLQDFTEKRSGELSGGNKRKLSTAMAIIGDPPVVFLDEPTTGMDPIARRSLWDTLTAIRERGRTLVLTSHSMEECEALCTRIAIMVNGQFKCLGSPQHLKDTFGDGYTLLARLGGDGEEAVDSNVERLSTFVQNEFPGSILKDIHHGYVHFQVVSAGVSWAKVFGTMERATEEYCIEDYSVSQTTLEQVFINFARAQVAPREEGLKFGTKLKSCCCFFCCCGCCKS